MFYQLHFILLNTKVAIHVRKTPNKQVVLEISLTGILIFRRRRQYGMNNIMSINEEKISLFNPNL